MKRVLVLGAGLVTKPMIDYYLDTCGYEVVLASRTVSKCERMIAGRSGGKAVTLLADDAELLESLIREADLVVCLIPRNYHVQVAELCIEHRRNMITTDFETPEMRTLDERVRAADLILLNEIGEDTEAYPNRDCRGYLEKFGLEPGVSLYRGLLRYVGSCNTMLHLKKLGLLENGGPESFAGKTNAGLVAELIGADSTASLKQRVADHLGLRLNDDVMERLDWLGLFREEPIAIQHGIRSDVLVDLMMGKLSYQPGEKDWIIVHNEVTAEFPDRREKRCATMAVEGIPHGDSAMSRAVALPTAIAGRLILQGKVSARGVIMPTEREIYEPVLAGMKGFGFEFVKRVEHLS